jgi:hypothetical protein
VPAGVRLGTLEVLAIAAPHEAYDDARRARPDPTFRPAHEKVFWAPDINRTAYEINAMNQISIALAG